MSDDKSQTGGEDRKRISLSEEYEMRDWAEKFGVTVKELQDSVGRVGPMADDVERDLKGS
ncbi:MAG: DUF3606 domain-containing protein [Brevundimonas sp.]|nr:MAG: DUF3606 domain-containing protein [Brevundimonas sp.]